MEGRCPPEGYGWWMHGRLLRWSQDAVLYSGKQVLREENR